MGRSLTVVPPVFAEDATYFLRRWLWLIVVGALAGGVMGFLATLLMPRLYQATATVFVTGSATSLGLAGRTGVLPADRIVATYAELVKSRPIVEAALSAAGTQDNYDTAARSIDVVPRRDAQIIQVSARASDPALAAAISNQLVLAANQQTQIAESDRLQTARTRLADLADQRVAQLAQTTRRVNDLLAQPAGPSRDQDLARAQTELAQAQQSYAAATRSLQDVDLAAARADDALSVVEPAVPVFTPAEPRVPLVVLIGVLLGLAGAVCAAALGHALSDSLPLPHGLTRVTGLPLLGTIPRTTDAPTLETLSHTRLVEPFRRARALVQARLEQDTSRAILVTSGADKAGTTTIAAGLAVALAHAGERVVLVDANLRAPRLHELFGLKVRRGLAHLLAAPAGSARAALASTGVRGLQLLPGGHSLAEAGNALGSPRMQGYLTNLRGAADVIVIDGPPFSASDGAALASLVDDIVLVFDAPRVRGRDARAVMTDLRSASAEVLGFVLNRADPGRDLVDLAVPAASEPQVRLSPVPASVGRSNRDPNDGPRA